MAAPVAIGEGITGWVARFRVPQLVDDTANDPRGITIPGTDEEQDESMLLAPMVHEGACLGVVVLVKQGLREGRLPHLRRLAGQGGFRPLSTTTPAMSPVAWSGFATGVDAGRHNIFDFLNRDLHTCLPVLSSTRLEPSGRVLRLGSWRLPLGKPRFELLRRSKAFWQVLGEHGVKATVLRVPITFPPEKVDGQMLSAMCVPDLRGTQGTFSWYSADPDQGAPIDGATAESRNPSFTSSVMRSLPTCIFPVSPLRSKWQLSPSQVQARSNLRCRSFAIFSATPFAFAWFRWCTLDTEIVAMDGCLRVGRRARV